MAKRREERRAAIVAAARDFAERDGWAAVTSRRLAEAIDYTQPVVYSHFSSMDAVADAVAIEGFAELTQATATARAEQTTRRGALEAVCRAYLSYAGEHPAVYDRCSCARRVSCSPTPSLPRSSSPPSASSHAVVEPFAGEPSPGDSETMAELLWQPPGSPCCSAPAACPHGERASHSGRATDRAAAPPRQSRAGGRKISPSSHAMMPGTQGQRAEHARPEAVDVQPEAEQHR